MRQLSCLWLRIGNSLLMSITLWVFSPRTWAKPSIHFTIHLHLQNLKLMVLRKEVCDWWAPSSQGQVRICSEWVAEGDQGMPTRFCIWTSHLEHLPKWFDLYCWCEHEYVCMYHEYAASIFVVVQFYPSGLKFIFFCFKLITLHYHSQNQKQIKFKPKMKLNHNINMTNPSICHVSQLAKLFSATVWTNLKSTFWFNVVLSSWRWSRS